MPYEIADAIKIAAAPENVWAVLTELENYPQWHPFYQSVTGQLTVGSTLTIKATSPRTGEPVTLTVKVLTVEAESELTWASQMVGMTTIKRRFLLPASSPAPRRPPPGPPGGRGGGGGPGGRRGALQTVTNLQGSYQAVNEAIKEQAEARQQRS